MSFNAQALLITPSTPAVAKGTQTTQAAINAAINPFLGGKPLVYKQVVGGAESGGLAGSYTTTFSNTASQPEDALIHYVAGSVASGAYLLVKGASTTSTAWYLFNLSLLPWNGAEDLVLDGFWAGPGAISYVALYGVAAQFTPAAVDNSVADAGTTLALLGLGLGAMGVVRRKVS